MQTPREFRSGTLFLLILCLIVIGCDNKRHARELPTPEVTISLPLSKEVTDYIELPGTTAALESVKIRARVKGWLDSINFTPGSRVKKGDVLFTIDPRMFKAQVDLSKAQLQAKKAENVLAETNIKRAVELLSTGSISVLKYDEKKAEAGVSEAQVGVAEAELEKAKLDLDYCTVTAPIDGRVSRNLVDVGNLVGASNETLLTEMVDDSSIYLYVNLSENEVLRLMNLASPSQVKSGQAGLNIPAFLALSNEKEFSHKGVMDFWAPELDVKTGTLQARAIFPNKDGKLMPGMFGKLRVPTRKHDALLVPEIAVGVAQAGSYVLVVNKDDVVEQKLVKTGQLDGTLRVIEEGIKKDDWVIVNGLQRATPGAKVNPQKVTVKDESEKKPVQQHPVDPK